MDASKTVVFISTLAAALADGKTVDEIDKLATFFNQLGNSLSAIALFRDPEDATELETP